MGCHVKFIRSAAVEARDGVGSVLGRDGLFDPVHEGRVEFLEVQNELRHRVGGGLEGVHVIPGNSDAGGSCRVDGEGRSSRRDIIEGLYGYLVRGRTLSLGIISADVCNVSSGTLKVGQMGFVSITGAAT